MNVWFLNLISWHLQGIIFARQNLQSTSPLLDIGNGNWNVLILRQCHVVEFVSYVSQSVQDIYFYSCQSTCTFVCTQLTENTKCVPNLFLFFFMAMFAVPRGKAYMCPFYIYKTLVVYRTSTNQSDVIIRSDDRFLNFVVDSDSSV